MNNIAKFLYSKFSRKQSKWYPFISVYYLTYDCDFRCSYCSDGHETPYYKLKSNNVSGSESIEIIKEIRKYTDYFVLTGGEPLNHPDFKKVISEIGKFEFKNLVLTTNGYDVDKFLPEISGSVDSLVFSVDTLNHQKADSLFGKSSGTFQKILDNLDLARKHQKRKYEIVISSVVTPDNIEDLMEVFEFSQSKGYEFAACPQLKGVKAHEALNDNFAYREFYNFLIIEKKKKAKIFGSPKYLEYMRDLKSFHCKPFTMLVVAPNGEIFYPCLEIGNLLGNIKEMPNLHEAKHQGFEKFGPQPDCGNQCHSACALTFALLMGNKNN